MESETMYCTVQEVRRIIKKARKRTFMIAVETYQFRPDNHERYIPGLGHFKVSRKQLLTQIFHHKEGKYKMFAQVVRGKAVVKVEDTGRIIFIG